MYRTPYLDDLRNDSSVPHGSGLPGRSTAQSFQATRPDFTTATPPRLCAFEEPRMESSTRQFARPQTCFGATARQDGVPPDKIWHNTTSGYAFTDKMCMTRRPVQAMPGGVGPSGRSFGDAYNATKMMHTGRGCSAPEYATGGSSAYATRFATRHDLQHEFRYNNPSRCGKQAAQK